MKSLQMRVMRGPNYWSSTQNKLIVLKLNQSRQAISLTQKDELTKSLAKLGIDYSGPLEDGETLCALTARIAVQLQTLAGMHVAGVDTRVTNQADTWYAIFPYILENAGVYAAESAVKFMNAWLSNQTYEFDPVIEKLKRINGRDALGPSTGSIVQEAIKRDIPFTRLDENSLIMLGQGANQRLIRAAMASSTSAIAVELAQDKESTKRVLHQGKIPVPEGVVIDSTEELEEAIDELGFPLVIKPLDGNHGRGITTFIRTHEEAVTAFKAAQQISDQVIVERHIHGSDYRFLVINYKLIAVAKRTPAHVTGDGVSTIQQLIDEVNKDPMRGVGHQNVLTQITVDAITEGLLAGGNFTLNSVLDLGRTLFLKDTANLSSGGTADDVTDTVHPHNIMLAERIARLMNLDICGIDIMAEDVTLPITKNNGAVLEVNACPGLRMHLSPSSGTPRQVGAPILDMLYPQNVPARIPLVAITGTNGKTTTTRLVAHLAKQAGYKPGYTTTDGININGQIIEQGDCSGPQSAAVILRDPGVNFAVLECARGGILRSGLGFDKCNVSIVTNISEDHLGLDGIDTIEDLTRVKAVVPQSTFNNGHAILNADDELVYHMQDNLSCNIALFSLMPYSQRIRRHLEEGKIAAIVEDGWFVICKGDWKYRVLEVKQVPLTFDGKSECMIKNVLPAMLAAYINNISINDIREGLKTFIPSPETTPGRMNVFEFKNFRLIIDYAHNEGGYQELKKYAEQVQASVKVGVIAATGDRRDQDIRTLGSLAAGIFDQIIIRHDKDGRGKTNDQLTDLLLEGIRHTKPNMPINIISDEFEAITYAIEHAEQDAWIFANIDDVAETVAFVTEMHQMDLIHNQNKISA